MKQARASNAEWEELIAWFEARENAGEPVPQWRRVVFGYEVMFTNACDPAKDYLDFKPGTSPTEIAALSDKARLAPELLDALNFLLAAVEETGNQYRSLEVETWNSVRFARAAIAKVRQ